MSDSFATPWTVARQASLSMGFPRQEYWSGLPFPSQGELPTALPRKPTFFFFLKTSLHQEPSSRKKRPGQGAGVVGGYWHERHLTPVLQKVK